MTFYTKNGIMYADSKPVIGMGVGYYASFNPDKYPVPPAGDRVGEMERDVDDIKALGFNIVRTSALGQLTRSGTELDGEFAFPEATLSYLEKSGLAAMLRLQNYLAVIDGEASDIRQLNQKGAPVDLYGSFLPDCVEHPAVISANEESTEYLSGRFAPHANLLYQLMYNEPAYAYADFHDYNPYSIKAYREWLVGKQIMTAEEAADYEPPRRRPYYDEDASHWINWRMFCTESLSRFLGRLGVWADRKNPHAESLTCTMPVPLTPNGVKLGEDIFDMAREMDVLGVTHYLPCFGEPIFYTMLYNDCLDSAAKLYGKHIWAAECNAHVTLTAEEYERETYTLIGAGFKGLIYYQWRADYDNGRGPEIGKFGFLHNDRTPTVKCGMIKSVNRLIAELSPILATSEKRYDKAAVLFSRHCEAFWDAHDNGFETRAFDRKVAASIPGYATSGLARSSVYTQQLHRELRRAGIAPLVVRAEDLAENKLDVKLLLIPCAVGLSDGEWREINSFAENGGYVFAYMPAARCNGYVPIEACKSMPVINEYIEQPIAHSFTLEDTLSIAGIKSPYRLYGKSDTLAFNVLEGEDGITVAVTNFDSFERPADGALLRIDSNIAARVTGARFYTFHSVSKVEIRRNTDCGYYELPLPEICTGGFLILKY